MIKKRVNHLTSFYLSDILRKTGLSKAKVLLIRHTLSNKICKQYYESEYFKEYSQIQNSNFPIKYEYWITFIGNRDIARLDKCYRVTESERNLENLNLNDILYEIIQRKCSKKEPIYFDIEEVDLLNDFENRLLIDWGNPRAWIQKMNEKNDKKIIAIQPKQKKKFDGYDNLILTYEELKEIIKDNLTYADWHTALSSIYAIYLIIDKKSGKQYVGSAYGKNGLLKRWSDYVNTKHGNNHKIIEYLKENPNGYINFQFSILQIFSKSMIDQDIVKLENYYKEKLLTKKFGFNDN